MKGTKPLQQQTAFKCIHGVTNYYALNSSTVPVSTQKQRHWILTKSPVHTTNSGTSRSLIKGTDC